MGAGEKEMARAPHETPPFTLGELKKAVPAHCFQRSALRSSLYVAVHLAVHVILCHVSLNHAPNGRLGWVVWPAVWFAQGCNLTGYWIIAHDCGHHAFSEYKLLDDAMGFFIHTSLLVPYFSWKYSHRIHHLNTASLEKDEAFVPLVRSQIPPFFKYLHTQLGRAFIIVVSAVAGWPSYLLFNASGHTYDKWTNHFDPYSPIYKHKERPYILLSDAGVLSALFLLYSLASSKGLPWLFSVYLAPLLVVHVFLPLIIFLQHTHPSLPRYDSSEWDWIRGALCTVDRDYGLLNKVFSDVGNTHVLHHLFTTIPHYNAREATQAVKPILGEYYQYDYTPILKAVWREVRECAFVEQDGVDMLKGKGVYWYRRY